jgi:hypothetical protein
MPSQFTVMFCVARIPHSTTDQDQNGSNDELNAKRFDRANILVWQADAESVVANL